MSERGGGTTNFSLCLGKSENMYIHNSDIYAILNKNVKHSNLSYGNQKVSVTLQCVSI